MSWSRPDLAIHRRTHSFADTQTSSDALYEQVAVWLGASAGDTVVDLGCGFGAGANYLAQSRLVNVVGLTASGRQRNIAESEARRRDIRPRPVFRVGTFDEPIDGIYGGAIAVESLVHAKDLDVTARHIRNSLRPGGRLVVVDDYWPDPAIPERALDGLGWGVNAYRPLESAVRSFEQNGFRICSVADLTRDARLMPFGVRTVLSRLPDLRTRTGFVATQMRFWRAQAIMHGLVDSGHQAYAAIVAERIAT